MSVRICWPTWRPRGDGPPAADRDEQHGRPLADCLDRYFVPQAATRAPSPPVTSSTALLDQLPDITVTMRDRPLTDLLRPAYLALGHSANRARGASE